MSFSSPTESAEAISLLRSLTEAHGVSGHEDAVRSLFFKELEGCGRAVTDRLGSAAVFTNPAETDGRPRVLVAGHMDEVGFAIQQITSRGFLKLVALGGWWTHTLVAQRVRILTASGKEIIGVIGSTPPHFLGDQARDKVIPLEQLYVDVGASSRDAVTALGIQLGDPVAPDSPFTSLNPEETLFVGKAFDNRCGIAATIQTVRQLDPSALPCHLIAGATVQEEVGCRGAVTLAALTRPDVALVLEGTPADDTHGMPAEEAQGAMGAGVQIRMLDPTALMNRKLVDHVVSLARLHQIPHQLAVRRSGGTDAKSFQLQDLGVPCIVLGTPSRYIHSHNSLIQLHDYLATLHLTRKIVESLTPEKVASLTQWHGA